MKISTTDVLGMLFCFLVSALILVALHVADVRQWLNDNINLPYAEWRACNITHTGYHCNDNVHDSQEQH